MTEFGKVVDRWSVRFSALVVSVGLGLACCLMGLASQLWMLVLALIGLRLFGQGMMGHVAMVATGRWFAANRGRAISLVSLGFPISQAILPALALLVMPFVGYSGVWFLAALCILCVTLPSLWGLLAQGRDPKSSLANEEAKEGPAWRRSDVLKLPIFYLLVIFLLHSAFTMTAFFFHQQSLMRTEGWGAEYFALSLPLFGVFGAGMSLVCGRYVDLWSAKALVPFIFIPMILGCFLIFLADGLWVLFVVVSLFGASLGLAQTVRGALWPELFGLKHLGEIRSTIAPMAVLATAIAPFITGYALDQGLAMDTQLAIIALSASGFSIAIFFARGRIEHISKMTPHEAHSKT